MGENNESLNLKLLFFFSAQNKIECILIINLVMMAPISEEKIYASRCYFKCMGKNV